MKSDDSVTHRLARVGMLAVCVAAAPLAEPRAFGGSFDPGFSTAPPGTRVAFIQGAAWNADDSPIPNAKLRLRNAITGRIDATAIADAAGRFTFPNVDGGTYVVELVSDSGKVLAVGPAFIVAPGETVATFVRLGAHVPWYAGFFANAAAAATAGAASLGVTALAPIAPPVSAKR